MVQFRNIEVHNFQLMPMILRVS